ncbi:hypothetical protein [Acidipropionibacterium timonense]|uniref:hypothetical protein n=1 Tax=Acidipropionibacterium timonense TaxID=2161818 RepID=UPI001030A4AE|nr:hypothetical protein [Acidipropionibacterium timonense]
MCPVELRNRLFALVDDNPLFALRIAHTMTEAWLMADRQGFAEYFKVSADRVPLQPELEHHAKKTLLAVCAKSRSRDIREEVVHEETETGPLYVDHLNEFAKVHWDIKQASANSPSLCRAVRAIAAMPKGLPGRDVQSGFPVS